MFEKFLIDVAGAVVITLCNVCIAWVAVSEVWLDRRVLGRQFVDLTSECVEIGIDGTVNKVDFTALASMEHGKHWSDANTTREEEKWSFWDVVAQEEISARCRNFYCVTQLHFAVEVVRGITVWAAIRALFTLHANAVLRPLW